MAGDIPDVAFMSFLVFGLSVLLIGTSFLRQKLQNAFRSAGSSARLTPTFKVAQIQSFLAPGALPQDCDECLGNADMQVSRLELTVAVQPASFQVATGALARKTEDEQKKLHPWSRMASMGTSPCAPSHVTMKESTPGPSASLTEISDFASSVGRQACHLLPCRFRLGPAGQWLRSTRCRPSPHRTWTPCSHCARAGWKTNSSTQPSTWTKPTRQDQKRTCHPWPSAEDEQAADFA